MFGGRFFGHQSGPIDVGDGTNLNVTDPILFDNPTDTLSFNQAFSFTWTASHSFNDTVTSNADWLWTSSFGIAFRETGNSINSPSTGVLDVKGTALTRIGIAGDTVIGDGTLRVMRPATNGGIDLGTNSTRFNDGFFGGDIDVTGKVIGAAGLKTIVSENNVSNPPTDAQLDTAFGTPASVGTGFIGIVDDSGAGSNVWLCVAVGTTWWYSSMTAAV